MREIKFRGKRVDNGEWVYGYYLDGYILNYIDLVTRWYASDGSNNGISDHNVICRAYEVRPETVCQYTELKDKNGKEVYESDIVSQQKWVSVGKYAQATGIVKYKGTGFTCDCIGEWEGSHAELNGLAIVLGNIYENPELL